MGLAERVFADSSGLTGNDVELLAKDGLATSGPITGFVVRHGQTIPFTLDTSNMLPEPRGIMIEQVGIAALLLASFVGPIYRVMSAII